MITRSGIDSPFGLHGVVGGSGTFECWRVGKLNAGGLDRARESGIADDLLIDGDLVVEHGVRSLVMIVLLGAGEEHLLIVVEKSRVDEDGRAVEVVGSVDDLVSEIHVGGRSLD